MSFQKELTQPQNQIAIQQGVVDKSTSTLISGLGEVAIGVAETVADHKLVNFLEEETGKIRSVEGDELPQEDADFIAGSVNEAKKFKQVEKQTGLSKAARIDALEREARTRRPDLALEIGAHYKAIRRGSTALAMEEIELKKLEKEEDSRRRQFENFTNKLGVATVVRDDEGNIDRDASVAKGYMLTTKLNKDLSGLREEQQITAALQIGMEYGDNYMMGIDPKELTGLSEADKVARIVAGKGEILSQIEGALIEGGATSKVIDTTLSRMETRYDRYSKTFTEMSDVQIKATAALLARLKMKGAETYPIFHELPPAIWGAIVKEDSVVAGSLNRMVQQRLQIDAAAQGVDFAKVFGEVGAVASNDPKKSKEFYEISDEAKQITIDSLADMNKKFGVDPTAMDKGDALTWSTLNTKLLHSTQSVGIQEDKENLTTSQDGGWRSAYTKWVKTASPEDVNVLSTEVNRLNLDVFQSTSFSRVFDDFNVAYIESTDSFEAIPKDKIALEQLQRVSKHTRSEEQFRSLARGAEGGGAFASPYPKKEIDRMNNTYRNLKAAKQYGVFKDFNTQEMLHAMNFGIDSVPTVRKLVFNTATQVFEETKE